MKLVRFIRDRYGYLRYCWLRAHHRSRTKVFDIYEFRGQEWTCDRCGHVWRERRRHHDKDDCDRKCVAAQGREV